MHEQKCSVQVLRFGLAIDAGCTDDLSIIVTTAV